MGRRDKEHPLSDRWLYNFLQRWPDLKLKKPRSLESNKVAKIRNRYNQVPHRSLEVARAKMCDQGCY